jgi:hypothetical protein
MTSIDLSRRDTRRTLVAGKRIESRQSHGTPERDANLSVDLSVK